MEVVVGNANSGRYPRLTAQERKQIISLAARGEPTEEIRRAVCRSKSTVNQVLRDAGGVTRNLGWEPSPARLSAAERETIAIGLAAHRSLRSIAAELGRAPSTISREVANNGGRHDYQAWHAHQNAAARARRPKPAKLASRPALRAKVEEWLGEQFWSPVQIAEELRREFPDDPMMRVSHETIYQALYVQGRGALRRELTAALRTGRTIRRNRSRLDQPGRHAGKVMISERPAEVADRAVPGHWEGDLIIGKANKSAVGTLVERSTRYVMLMRLGSTYDAEAVLAALTAKILTLPEHLRRSLTWDQGSEMARHREFTIATGVQVFFCDPHSPWQRGTNENTNGLLRQWMPKGTDLSDITQDDLDTIAHKLNNRPRQTLGWMKPSQALANLVAPTD